MKKSKVLIYTSIILIVTILLTLGYSAFSDQLMISSTVSHFRAYKVVRINGVTTNSGSVSNLDYDTNSILNTVYIPAGGSVTYSVTATNLGNVPVAVSNVTFKSGNTPISNLSSNISVSNYEKICNTNNECTGGVSKTFNVTITNNGSTEISTELDAELTFKEVYTIKYEGTAIGEALAGSNYTYTFQSNAPSKLAKASGTCDNFTYTGNTLTVTNVESDLNFIVAHTITYNGAVQGYINDGNTYTYTFQSEWPAAVTKNSGTCDQVSYQNHTITLTNVRSDVSLTGTIGKVEISNISYVQNSAKNVLDNPIPTPVYNDMDVTFSITFERPEGSTESDFEVSYNVSITNTHYNDYIFRGFDFHPTIYASATSDTADLYLIPTGIENGDVIASGETKTFTVTLKLVPSNPDGNYNTTGETQVDTTADTEEETGTITATISPNTGDLRAPNTQAAFTVTVTSTYPSDREFTLILSNSNLEITANGGTALGNMTIHGNSTETYTIYIRGVTGATFLENTATTNVYLSTAGSPNISVGSLTLNVDIYNVPDTTPITVGKVQISMHRSSANAAPTTGQIDVTWDRIDKGGEKVADYVVQLYRSGSSTVAYSNNTGDASKSLSITGVADGTYKAVVYGIDEAPNSGASYASSQTTTANGYASASTEEPFEWRFNVSVTARNLTITGNGNDVALLEQSHTVTVTATGSDNNGNNYIVANGVEVKMGGQTLTEGSGDNQYTFSRSNNNTVGTIVINKVTGNIEVGAERTTAGNGGCLVKGTKILLANGKYKNVENIDYDDLLLTYNHETGELVPEYPIWLKTAKKTNGYQVTTFSDGSVLKSFGIHGMFETDLKRFVDVTNREEFHVGSKVARLNDTKTGLTTVTVTKIEDVFETIDYYHVVTTNYFNNFADGLFVSDGHVDLLNRYGFNEDITWNEQIRNYAKQDIYTYEELKDVLPRHLFEGTLAAEAKILTQSGYGLEKFSAFIQFITGEMMKEPINYLGKNMWMVTTSEDNITELNKNNYLRYEESTYTLPASNKSNFIGWYNTKDNKIYKPGDKIIIYHGTHFEAIYK